MTGPSQSGNDLRTLALELITSRFSVSPKRLVAPGPTDSELRAMVEAAGCAPDHELLRPWRLVRIGLNERQALGELFVACLQERDAEATALQLAQAREKAYRAPELLLAIAKLAPEHQQVPPQERYVALGAALMNLLLAAHGCGYAAMLTSGQALKSKKFEHAFCLHQSEVAVCFVAIGTATEVRRRARPAADALISNWRPPS